MRRAAVLLSLLCVVASGCVAAVPGPDPGAPGRQPAAPAFEPEFEEAPCWLELPAEVTVVCGYVTVPLEHARPESGTVRLATLVAKAETMTPLPDPVVFLSGGPGQGATDFLPFTIETGQAPASLLAERDLVFVDQRGTGYSEPSLACPEETDAFAGADLNTLSQESETALSLGAIQACRDRLVDAEGVALEAFDTTNNVADLDLVRRALGYEQVNLYGVSYGAKLGLQTLRGNPPWVRSATLTSVVAPTANFVVGASDSFQSSLNTVYAQCAADPACAQWGDLAAAVESTTARLAAEPAVVTYASPISGETRTVTIGAEDYMATLFQGLYIAPFIQEAPAVIAVAAEGNMLPVALYLELLSQDSGVARGMYFSNICAEEIHWSVPRGERRNATLQPAVRDYYETPGTQSLDDACEIWDVAPSSPLFRVPVLSTIPTLLVTGEFDPITPPEWGERVDNALPNSQLVAAKAVGHDPLSALGDCGSSLLAAFVTDPAAPVDGTCAQQPVDFLDLADLDSATSEMGDGATATAAAGLSR